MKFRSMLVLSGIFVLFLGLVASQEAVAGPMVISRASTDPAGVQGNDASQSPAISADGRYVAFHSGANNLVSGDTNNAYDIFVKDTWTGAITRVSTDSFGAEANDYSYDPVISADGRYVAFDSYATNLVSGDTNNTEDVFVKDTLTGGITLVSTDASGSEGNYDSFTPAISGDGTYVAFESNANNLVSGDNNTALDIFVKNVQTGNITQVSTDSSGNEGDNTSQSPSISGDGKYVAFRSSATNLVTDDTNGKWDIFIKDTLMGTTSRVSTDSFSAQANNDSDDSAISADGRYVAFESYATNLVPGDNNSSNDVFVKDTATGETIRVDTDSAGNQANQGSSNIGSAISADGRYVAFGAHSNNLVPNDTNAVIDVFVKDTLTGGITRVSTDSTGAQVSTGSSDPVLSADGRYAAYFSLATNLVPGDTNGAYDIFVTRAEPDQVFTWYDNLNAANWILFANPTTAPGDAWFDLSVAGQLKGLPALPGLMPGQVPPGSTLYASYPGLMGGPVDAGYHAQSEAMSSQRTLWAGNSLEELVGTDTRKLSDHFYWTWYDQVSPDFANWVLVSNPGINPVYYQIKVAGAVMAEGSIDPGQNVTPTFPGTMGGPVEVLSWADQAHTTGAPVMASQRVLSNNGTAFNEVPGIGYDQLASDYLWTWYDMSGTASNWVLIANPSDAASSLYYEVWIGGQHVLDGGPVAAGDRDTPTFPGMTGGPVEVKTFSDPGHTVAANAICSQRSLWGPSFEEVPGYDRTALGGRYNWTWYDMASAGSQNWVLIANPGSIQVTADIKVAGVTVWQGTIDPQANVTPTFAGVIGGPVEVSASGPVMASQRVLWSSHFNEVLGTVLGS